MGRKQRSKITQSSDTACFHSLSHEDMLIEEAGEEPNGLASVSGERADELGA